jgi:hypothetical protein
MPLSIIVVSPFPLVPQLPGVPQLARSLLFPPPALPSVGSSAPPGVLWHAVLSTPVWGVFNANGEQVITPDSVIDFENRNEWRVSNYPVQSGGFASYNKVVVPAENSLRMTKGGTKADRAAFIAQIDAIAGDTNLYTILTPEKSYQNCNLMRYEITRRGVSGAFFLTEVDIFFTTINQVAVQFSTTGTNSTPTPNASQPSALPSTNQGTVQTRTPAPSTIAGVNSFFASGPP